MKNVTRDIGETWQDSLEPLTGEIEKCARKLSEDAFLSLVKSAFISAQAVQHYLDDWTKSKSATRVECALLHSLILNHGRMTPTQIGKEILRSKHMVTRIVDSLEERGWVKREPFGDDLRTRDIVITRKGIEIINERTDYFQNRVVPKVLHHLDEKRLGEFKTLLRRIEDYL